jgi:hypothetical protein
VKNISGTIAGYLFPQKKERSERTISTLWLLHIKQNSNIILLPFGKKAHKIMKTYYKISQWMLLARLLF